MSEDDYRELQRDMITRLQEKVDLVHTKVTNGLSEKTTANYENINRLNEKFDEHSEKLTKMTVQFDEHLKDDKEMQSRLHTTLEKIHTKFDEYDKWIRRVMWAAIVALFMFIGFIMFNYDKLNIFTDTAQDQRIERLLDNVEKKLDKK